MFQFRIWGERACFARSEFRRDLISYDVIPPLAARGIIDAIYWTPAIRWHIDRIHVLGLITLEQTSLDVALAGQRVDLIDVDYLIEAHFTLTERARSTDHVAQHASLVRRRAARQQPYRQPFLGLPKYPAQFRLVSEEEVLPPSPHIGSDIDLGWMIHDLDDQRPPNLHLFRARMRDGVIETGGDWTKNLPI